jgi:hypothetical protein
MYSCIFLLLGTRWKLLVSFMTVLLYLRRNSIRFPLDSRLGGTERIWMLWNRTPASQEVHPLFMIGYVETIFEISHLRLVGDPEGPELGNTAQAIQNR